MRASMGYSILIVLMVFATVGCFETGTNQGSQKVLLVGSLLKGVISEAKVSLRNERGVTLWSGTSDSNGGFKAQFNDSNSAFYTIVADASLQGAMKCDATECHVPDKQTPYAYGELIDGSELGDARFKTLWHEDEFTKNRQLDKQVNGFTTLVTNLIESKLANDLSKNQFDSVAAVGSQITLEMFGVPYEQGRHLLDVKIPNVGDISGSGQSDLVTSLALVNAALSSDISYLALFTSASIGDGSGLLSPELQEKLGNMRHKVMLAANSLIQSGHVAQPSSEVMQGISDAIDTPIDFNKLSALVRNLETVANEVTTSDVVTFEDSNDRIVTFGSMSFTNKAWTTSGRSPSYSSSNTEVVTVDNGVVTIVGVGSATISAHIDANENYDQASADYFITVKKADDSLIFDESTVVKTYGDMSFFSPPFSRMAEDGNVQYQVDDTSVASVDSISGEVNIMGAGVAKVRVTVTGSKNYNDVSLDDNAYYELKVDKAQQSISFSKPSPLSVTTESRLTNIALGGTGIGEITYGSSNPSIAIVNNDGVITPVAIGEVNITATKAADNNYESAYTTYSLTVIPHEITITAELNVSESDLYFSAGVEGLELYRSSQADCDWDDYLSCPDGNLTVLNGAQIVDDLLAQETSAYFYLKSNNLSVGPFQIEKGHFPALRSHQVVEFQGKLWSLGGESLDNTVLSSVWSSNDGIHWLEVTATDFIPRYDHQVTNIGSVLVLTGGNTQESVRLGDSWLSSDGTTWEQQLGLFPEINDHQMIFFNDKVLSIGGKEADDESNQVWASISGEIWGQVNADDYGKRHEHQVVEFLGRIWIIGGLNGGPLNDIWSSVDGVTWIPHGNAPFSNRYQHQVASYNGKLWLIGGRGSDSEKYSDIWSSFDGINWDLASSSFPVRLDEHQLIEFSNKLWVFGGLDHTNESDYVTDIWSTRNGITWLQNATQTVTLTE